MADLKKRIDCAMKRKKCDLVITGVKVFNVFTGKLDEGDIAVADGAVVGIGKGYEGIRSYDGKGAVAIPGLMDAHIHVESSTLSPEAFAQIVCAHGATAIVADPHEIVNVCGIQGAEYIRESFDRLSVNGVCPLDVYLQLPSCVPATPFETSGAVIDGKETERELARDIFFGLGEVMNYPGVIGSDPDMLQKLQAADALGKVADGHAPGLTGDALNAYLCGGMRNDHENLTPEECREKVAKGMYIQVRCGSSTNNLADAVKACDEFNFRRFITCTDDKNARDLSQKGHLDDLLRRLVSAGMPAERAVVMATLNVAECYRLKGKGAIAPGYCADLALVNNLKDFRVQATFKCGHLVAEGGKALFEGKRYLPESVLGTVRVKDLTPKDFAIPCKSGKLRAICVSPQSTIVTQEEIVTVGVKNGYADLTGTGLCKLAVVERHFASGRIGLGVVKGYGFKGGAIGISVAHDAHNLVVLGDSDEAMARVVALLKQTGGGMALVSANGEETFPFDIAGLMSSAPLEEVVKGAGDITVHAQNMGVTEGIESFMTLVFLSLAVIPNVRLTDYGLVDVNRFQIVPLEV
ncbi:MAG: adenine deaminase [Clostridia bacterium]|nr:adenine deaminase [Clostridia bacterium]